MLKTVLLDVRDVVRQGRSPFPQIMQTVAALEPDENFVLIAPFQPTALTELFAREGLKHSTRPLQDGRWEVLFTRTQSKGQTLTKSARRNGGCRAISSLEMADTPSSMKGLMKPNLPIQVATAAIMLLASASLALANGAKGGAAALAGPKAAVTKKNDAPRILCPLCRSEWSTRTVKSSKGAQTYQLPIARHLCPTCVTTLGVKGHGKAKKDLILHRCSHGSRQVCCAQVTNK